MRSFGSQVAALVALIAAVTIITDLAGAANLGTALTFAQLAFAVAVTALIVKR